MDQSPRPKQRPKLRISFDDIKKIERVVSAEAEGEGIEGRNAIRGVILNRLMSDRFPNTVDEVLNEKGQFEPVGRYKGVENIPVDEELLNERLAEWADYIQLGKDASQGSTFFLNKELSAQRGTDFGGKEPLRIGNHTFYKGYEGQEPVTDINFSHDVEVAYDEGGFVADDLTRKFYEENSGDAKALAKAYGVEYTEPEEWTQLAKDLGQFAWESLPGIGTAYTIDDIKSELEKEEPNYLKIGMLAGSEVAGLIPGLGSAAKNMIRKGSEMARQTDKVLDVSSNIPAVAARGANKEFKNTVKAYKLFTKGEDGKLYPLFVDADTEVPVGEYMKAVFPEYRFKAENGNFYVPSRGTAGKKGTGDAIKIPDQETRDMLIEAGFLPKGSKAKTIKAVAARPGWHAGDTPMAKHIGPEVVIDGKTYKIRGNDQVWAEVEMPADVDWQAIADSRATLKKDGTPNVKTAHITDELPLGGYYRYKTNPNMEGQWLISGDMKVNRILDRDEVKRINAEAGFEDLPTEAELREQLGKGFAAGGLAGEDMYQGVDDYQMAEMGAGMKEGGSVHKQTEAVFKLARGFAKGGEVGEAPDTTIGVDDVSGNEIPMGARPEEVRDDIPAQLSEGEYVVPADVVRYYGVKFFEDLRTEAKVGWQNMEQNGRIGGTPVAPEGMEMGGDELPFDISELQISDSDEQPMMNAGGYMRGYALGGFADYGNNSLITVVEYVNDAGESIWVQFMGDKPLTIIPEGFRPADTAAEEVAKNVQEQTVEASTSDDGGDRPPVNTPEPIDWKNTATVEDFNNYLSQKESTLNKVVQTGAALVGGLPMMGLMKAAIKMEDKRMLSGLEAQIESLPKGDPKRVQLEEIKTRIGSSGEVKSSKPSWDTSADKNTTGYGIFGGQSTLKEGLTDVSGDGRVSFADTWLGDFLGIGPNNDFGIEKGNPGLSASIGGARRNNTGGSTPGGVSSGSTSNTSSSPSIPATSGTKTKSFSEAFKEARTAQGSGGTFEWNGNKYSTNYASEASTDFNPDGST